VLGDDGAHVRGATVSPEMSFSLYVEGTWLDAMTATKLQKTDASSRQCRLGLECD
jgi:hypothetical protein